jgi:transcriptional regulator with XRE-family HTH domain
MDEAIKQIGERLKGLREVLNIPAEEVAELCDISLDHYLKIESGEADPSVYRLSKISKRYGIDLDGAAARSSNLINGSLWVFASLLQ